MQAQPAWRSVVLARGQPPASGYLTYNNLFFPNGSPIDCDFPFSGTFVDVFGMAFTVAGGYTVNLWGDGDMNGPGTTTYGVALTQGSTQLVYQFAGVDAAVPEPSSLRCSAPACWECWPGGNGRKPAINASRAR